MTNTEYGQPNNAPLANSYPTNYPPAYAAPAVDPGRGLGIAGLILALLFNVVGLIVSIVAFRKSKRAGFRNSIALGGIVVGVVMTLLAIGGGVALALTATSLVSACNDLGPGQHVVNGVTYTCG